MASASSRLAAFRRFGWLTGLPILAAIVGTAGQFGLPSLERRLRGDVDRVATATEDGAEPWLQAATRGRDVVVKGEAPNPALRDEALARLQRLPGLRHVVGPLGLVEEASPFVWKATRAAPDRIDLSGNRPAELGPLALAARLAPDLPPETTLKDEAVSARGAPPEFSAASAYAVEQLGALTPGSVVTLTDTMLSFRGEAASIASYDALRLALAKPPEGFSLGTVDILPPRTDDFRFSVERGAAGIALTGNVVSEAVRQTLLARANDVANGMPVDDRMQTARGLTAAIDPAALTGFAFDLAALLQDGSVSFAEGRLTVAGVAIDGQAISEVETLMRTKRPVGIEGGPVALTTRPLRPYRVLVRRDADSVTVSGHVPDDAMRDRILAAIRPRFFRERIVDKLRLAQGAPSDLPVAVDAGVTALSLLAKGQAAVTDRSLQVTGESLYRESANRLARDLPRKVPVGWSAEAAIQAPDGPVLTDPQSCRTLFGQTVQDRALRFTAGSAALPGEFYPVLDAVAALAKTCPDLRIVVAGHGDPPNPKPTAPDTGAARPETATPAPDKAAQEKEVHEKSTAAKAPPMKAPPVKAPPAKAATGKAPADKSKNPPTQAQATPAPPEPDLPRQRSQAIVDYLLTAGVSETAVTASGSPRSAAQGIGLGLGS